MATTIDLTSVPSELLLAELNRRRSDVDVRAWLDGVEALDRAAAADLARDAEAAAPGMTVYQRIVAITASMAPMLSAADLPKDDRDTVCRILAELAAAAEAATPEQERAAALFELNVDGLSYRSLGSPTLARLRARDPDYAALVCRAIHEADVEVVGAGKQRSLDEARRRRRDR
jgi:hypothetical protein